MPSPNLSEPELARVRAGRCACGCGKPIPEPVEDPGPLSQLYHGSSCKQRAYRQRRKAGRVVTLDARRRAAALEEAREWSRRAAEAKSTAAYWKGEEDRCRAKAAELAAFADGQTTIPGCEPVSRRKAHA